MKSQTFWTNMNRTIKLLMWVAVIVVAISLYFSFVKGKEAEEWKDRYNDFRERAALVSARADSLEREAVLQKQRADEFAARVIELEKQNETLSAEVARLKELLKPISDQNDITFQELTQNQPVEVVVKKYNPQAEPWIRLSYSLHHENSLLDQTVNVLERQVNVKDDQLRLKQLETEALNRSLTFQTERADALQKIVDAIPPPPPDEKLLGIIPLPNRKTSMLIGAVGGVVTTAAIIGTLND